MKPHSDPTQQSSGHFCQVCSIPSPPYGSWPRNTASACPMAPWTVWSRRPRLLSTTDTASAGSAPVDARRLLLWRQEAASSG